MFIRIQIPVEPELPQPTLAYKLEILDESPDRDFRSHLPLSFGLVTDEIKIVIVEKKKFGPRVAIS